MAASSPAGEGNIRMRRAALIFTAAALCLAASAAAAQMSGPMAAMGMAPMPTAYAGQADKPGAPVFTGLGNHHHQISTRNPAAQALFDQGVRLLFGFNHA